MQDFCTCVESEDCCPLCQLDGNPEVAEPLLEDPWSDVETIKFEQVAYTICYRQRLVETYFGPELEVIWWKDGDGEESASFSSEPASAETQIMWELNI